MHVTVFFTLKYSYSNFWITIIIVDKKTYKDIRHYLMPDQKGDSKRMMENLLNEVAV